MVMKHCKCPTCHGRGHIRPTQDPRFLFWAEVSAAMHLYHWKHENINAVMAWRYALGKLRAILSGQPRRTTATWKGRK